METRGKKNLRSSTPFQGNPPERASPTSNREKPKRLKKGRGELKAKVGKASGRKKERKSSNSGPHRENRCTKKAER